MEGLKKLYLAVDIGGTSVKIGLVDEDGNFRHTSEYPVNFDGYETPILETVVKSCSCFLTEHRIYPQQLTGAGVSATGYINTEKGSVDGGGGFIRNWTGSQIRERMEADFRIPVYVLNDANAAALGEVWLGAAMGRKNVVMLTIGTGVGGGIITEARLLLGRRGFAGEIGHMILHRGGKRCHCGNEGCLEKYAAMTVLVEDVRRAIEEGKVDGTDTEQVNGRWIFETIGKGNQDLEEIADRWMEDIAAGIVNLVYIFNPEMVILGGGVSSQKELFIDRIREKVTGMLPELFSRDLEIVAASLANRAGMAGAVYYCMKSMREGTAREKS